MKLEIARGLFLIGALTVASLAVAAWEQPRTQVLSSVSSETHCPVPRAIKASVAAQPDNDLLLLMFGLAQGIKPQG